jgi:hypothetical protein
MMVMVVDHRTKRQATPAPGDHRSGGAPMIAIGFGLLALFSVLSILLGSEDPRQKDPRDDIRIWMRYGVR